MNINVQSENEPALQVISVRVTTSMENLPKAFDENYTKIQAYIAEMGAEPAGPPFGAYYNHDMENLDVEMGFPVTKPLPETDQFKSRIIPERKAVTCLFKGSYSQLDVPYKAVYDWIEQNKLEIADAHYDFYLNDPCSVPEAELLTKVSIPVKSN